MANFDLLDSAAPLMKRYYNPGRVYSMSYKNRPLYAWLPKKTGIVGEHGGYVVPITIDDIPGESADFKSAVAARDGDSHEAWFLNRVKRYGTATLDGETIEAMQNSTGAFMRATQPRIKSAINQLANSNAFSVYRDGTGVRGRIGAITTGVNGTITLTNPEDARSFGLRRLIVAVDGAGAVNASPRGGALTPNVAKVKGVNIKQGIITFEDIPAGHGWSTAADDYLFVLGDTANGGTSRVCEGMGSWGPTVAPAAGALFKGVDRAKFPEKLLMLHYPASGVPIDQAVREAGATVQANEGAPDALFVSPMKWAALETKLASQSRYDMMMGDDGATGFDSIVINAGGGKINVVADPNCPENKGYMLQRDTWGMYSINTFPGFVSKDGQRLARIMDEDAVEFRMGGYYNVGCEAPGHNLVIDFDVAP